MLEPGSVVIFTEDAYSKMLHCIEDKDCEQIVYDKKVACEEVSNWEETELRKLIVNNWG